MVVILPDGLYEARLNAPAANSRDFMCQYPADRLIEIPEANAAKSESKAAKKPPRQLAPLAYRGCDALRTPPTARTYST